MASGKVNLYKGETITLKFKGNDAYVFESGSDPDKAFEVYVYVDGLYIKDAERKDVKIIKSSDTEYDPGHELDESDGYVKFISGENEVWVILPYQETMGMKEDSYTVEMRYGTDMRSVIKRKSAFLLAAAVSQKTF